MTTEFQAAYAQLNAAQKKAVDTIEGPVLVIAGPGTGKTQLLSTRVANIMRLTDTAPANILCLTYTDNAARNMRERLETVVGQAAFHVTIQTFHSFGADLINRYSDYFAERQFLQQIDELGRYELLRSVFDELPHANPLSSKVGDDFVHLHDTLQVISWLKQNALSPEELQEILAANKACIDALADDLSEIFALTASPKRLPHYGKFLQKLHAHVKDETLYGFPDYARDCAAGLAAAITDTPADGRWATAITAWRNEWCVKNEHGKHVFKDDRGSKKMVAVAEVYQELNDRMASQGLYDFDDMIVEVVKALETNDELRFTLQERYQYLLVDEFQDTNKAQLRILTALGDNPVYEMRPNIMVVGDDDQAIYAFQGAEVSNMVAFARAYREPSIITLGENYRSSAAILTAAFGVADQISDRLETLIADSHKQLTAQVTYDHAKLQHTVFPSELAQYEWVAEQIDAYIKAGTQPEDIAVIAPRHRYLENLAKYLGPRHIPMAYERRDNILDSDIIIELLTMASLVHALSEQRFEAADSLLAQVLSYEFWELPDEQILELSIHCFHHHESWLEATSKSKHAHIKQITLWFVALSKRAKLEPLEYVLDQLMGGLVGGRDNEFDDLLLPTKPVLSQFVSPMHDYYFNPERYENSTDKYLSLLGQLSTLRHRLREWRPADTLYIKDLVDFVELHRSAGLKIVDTNPHTQTTNAVQLMTAYKAKGLEFGVVFVINAQDEVWGPTAKNRSLRISLPKNLPLAPANEGVNDKLRLLFVALTRAKHDLHVTGYSHKLDNKLSPGLSFISELSAFVPRHVEKPTSPEATAILATDWAYRFRQVIADKSALLEPVLADYKLSVTHLNNFIDIVDSGPQYFLTHNLLRFPQAPTPSAAYGDAVHKTLQWAHNELKARGNIPAMQPIIEYFDDSLRRKHLRANDLKRLSTRGREALRQYFAERGDSWQAKDAVERGFNNEGVIVAGARLSGKIDKMHYLDADRICVIDFKTGKPLGKWGGSADYEQLKLHKYRQQLLFYKLLVEGSASFSRKLQVVEGALEFVEPGTDGELVDNLSLIYDAAELANFTKLIGAVWEHIVSLQFPDTSKYSADMRGVLKFEQDLIDGTI